MASDIILASVLDKLSVADDDPYFVDQIKDYIDGALATLEQLGIGPEGGFSIDETTPWSAIIGSNPRYNPVKTYVMLRARLLFDPPTLSFHITLMQEQIKELEWRLNAIREDTMWTPPPEPIDPELLPVVISGGDANDLPDWGD